MIVVSCCWYVLTSSFLFSELKRWSDDESYNEAEADSESIGLQDTDIDDDELADLEREAEAEATMPPKTRKSSRSPKKPTRTEVEEIDVMVNDFNKVSLKKVKHYDLSYRFPMQLYTAQDGTKEIVHLSFQVMNLPRSFLRMAKVLPGGMKFGLLMGSPKWFFEEGFLVSALGGDWNEDHARVQSRNASVVQPIRRSASGLERFLPGDVQVIDLPFKCIEGEHTPQWGDWRTRDMEDIVQANPGGPDLNHIQFQKTVSFVLVSQHDHIERLEPQTNNVYGFADGEAP